MRNEKKLYKYTSIISLVIVLSMLANLIIPTLTIADDEVDTGIDSITLSEIVLTEEENTLTIEGTIANKYSMYSWYWTPGKVTTSSPNLEGLDEEQARQAKLDYMDALVAEFQSNAIKTAIDQTGNSFTSTTTIPAIEGENVSYKFLCIAKNGDGAYAISYKQITFNATQQDEGTNQENNGTEGSSTETPTTGTDEETPTVTPPGNEGGESSTETPTTGTDEITPGNENEGTSAETTGNGTEGQNQIETPSTGNQENNQTETSENGNNGETTETGENTQSDDEGEIIVHVDEDKKDDKEQEEYVETESETEKVTPKEEKQEENKEENKVEPVVTEAKKEEQKNTTPIKNNVTTTTQTNGATEDMPQTGSNNTGLIVAIVVFSMLSAVSFVKYRLA